MSYTDPPSNASSSINNSSSIPHQDKKKVNSSKKNKIQQSVNKASEILSQKTDIVANISSKARNMTTKEDPKTSAATAPIIARHLQAKKEQMAILRSNQGMARAVGENKKFNMAAIPGSQNPVTHLLEEQFIPVSIISKSHKMGSIKDTHVSIKRIYKGLSDSVSQLEVRQKRQQFLENNPGERFPIDLQPNDIEKFYKDFKEKITPPREAQPSKAYHQHVLSELQEVRKKIEEVTTEDSPQLVQKKLALVSRFMDKINQMVALEELPHLYAKDEILSKLRAMIASQETPHEVGEILVKTIKDLTANSASYIRENDIPIPLPSHKWLLSELEPYISSYDILANNNFSSDIQTYIEQLVRKHPADVKSYTGTTGYAFKLGAENERELLAGTILTHFGLGRYITPKKEAQISSGELLGIVEPVGIYSPWIDGKKDEEIAFKKNLSRQLKKYGARKAKAAKHKDPKDVEKMEESRGKVYELTPLANKANIQELALVDALLFSGDSHAEQYKRNENGDFECFDFARFLPPTECFTQKGLTYIALRSLMLSHPFAEEPIDPSLRKKIENLDPEQMKTEFNKKGLLASEEYFNDHINKIKDANQKIAQIEELANTDVDCAWQFQGVLASILDSAEGGPTENLNIDIPGLLQAEGLETDGANIAKNIVKYVTKKGDFANNKQMKIAVFQFLKQGCDYVVRSTYSDPDNNNLQDLYNSLKKATIDLLEIEKTSSKKACYKKIHPDAFDAMERRIRNMQECLKTKENPSVIDLFNAANPDVATILKSYEKIIGLPMLNAWIQDNAMVSIEDMGKKMRLPKAEQDEFSEALKRIKAKAKTRHDLCCAMDL